MDPKKLSYARIRARLDNARDLYRRDDYQGALDVYNYLAPLEDTDVYEGRALTHLKLSNTTEALRDAQQIAKLKPRDSRGYLLLGRILEKRKQYHKAQQVYTRGLSLVAARSDSAKRLKQARENLYGVIGQREGRDPFVWFPLDVLAEIFDCFPFHELVLLLVVSQRWNNGLKQLPWLWRNLDFSRARRLVKPETLKAYVAFSKGSVTRMNLWNVFAAGTDQIYLQVRLQSTLRLRHLEVHCNLPFTHHFSKALCSATSHIETLILGDKVQVTWEEIEALATSSMLKKLAVRSPGMSSKGRNSRITRRSDSLITSDPALLEHLELRNLVNLETRSDTLWNTIRNLTNLRTLVLSLNSAITSSGARYDLYDLPSLRHFSSGTFDFIRAPPTLEHFAYSIGVGVHEIVAEEGFPNLVSLKVDQIDPIAGSMLVENRGNLRELTITSASYDEHDVLGQLLSQGYFSSIQSLQVSGSRLEDAFFCALAESCPELTELAIPQTPTITGVSVKALATMKKGKQLAYLDLQQCPGVGRDAIDLATRRGIRVTYGGAEKR